MALRDLTVSATAVKHQAEYACLLTGHPCGLVSVTLRRMFVIPPIWVGWRALVVLPLEKAPSLAIGQYLRMLRPYAVLLGAFFSSVCLRSLIDPKPGTFLFIGAGAANLAIVVGLWCVLGRLLDRFEFVRLLRCSKGAGTVTLRFSTDTLAQRASEVLFSPKGRQESE